MPRKRIYLNHEQNTNCRSVINKTTQGEHSIYSDGNINVVSNKKASMQGDDGGVKMSSDPKDAPQIENTTGIICKVDVRPSSDWK